MRQRSVDRGGLGVGVDVVWHRLTAASDEAVRRHAEETRQLTQELQQKEELAAELQRWHTWQSSAGTTDPCDGGCAGW